MEEITSLDWVEFAFKILFVCVPMLIAFTLTLIGVIKYLTRPGYKEIDEKKSKEECQITARFERKSQPKKVTIINL